MSTAAEATARPLRKDAELNRQKILQAAAEVFAARGLEVTLDDIAAHAGVGVGTVYRRFPSKDALIEALFESKIDRMVATAEAAAADPDGWRAFVEFLHTTTQQQAEDRGLHMVLHSARYGHDRVANARERMAVPVGRLIDAAKAAGGLRADFEVTDVPMILVMINGLAMKASGTDPCLYRRYLDIVIEGLKERPDRDELTCPALTQQALSDAMAAAKDKANSS